MVNATAVILHRTGRIERGTLLVLQVGRMVVVENKLFLEVLGQFTLRVKGRQAGGAGLLPGRGVLVVGGVEQVRGPAGQEPAVLASFGHAPQH